MRECAESIPVTRFLLPDLPNGAPGDHLADRAPETPFRTETIWPLDFEAQIFGMIKEQDRLSALTGCRLQRHAAGTVRNRLRSTSSDPRMAAWMCPRQPV